MLNFSGHRVRANYSAREGTNAINTWPSIKTRSRKSIFGRAIFFFLLPCVRPRFRPDGRFLRCADNEDNNEITLRSITRRYPRRLPIRACIGFFPLPRSISNISDANSYQMRTPTKSYALLACSHGANKHPYHQKYSDCTRLQYPHLCPLQITFEEKDFILFLFLKKTPR